MRTFRGGAHVFPALGGFVIPAAVAGPRASQFDTRRRSRQLYFAGLTALVFALGYFAFNARVENGTELGLGLTMLALAVYPGLRWARRAKFGLPLFETFMFTSFTTYALPLLTGHRGVTAFDSTTIQTAALAVVVFQTSALGAFLFIRVRKPPSKFWSEEIIDRDISKFLSYGLVLSSAYTVIAAVTDWIPPSIDSILRAVAYGLGTIAIFIQSRRWGQGDLTSPEKLFFAAMLAVQITFSWASLLLVGGISTLILAVLGYISGGKRIPILLLAGIFPLLAILHNGKGRMREKYWEHETRPPTLLQLPAFFSEWVTEGLVAPPNDQPVESNRLLERTSLFHLMCLVASVTPERQPYLYGLTYEDIPSQFVPRLLWPGKPTAHVSTYRLAIYYGLQTEEETKSTTIGFGWVTEAYANFGFFGAALVGTFFGALFGFVQGKSEGESLLTYGGLLTVILTAWAFQTELTMSIWLGSLLQSCVAVLGLTFLLKYLLRIKSET